MAKQNTTAGKPENNLLEEVSTGGPIIPNLDLKHFAGEILSENSDNDYLNLREEMTALESSYFVVCAENSLLKAKIAEIDFTKYDLVNRDQLNLLIVQVCEYKADIVALVNVFQSFAGLFSGKTGLLGILPVITRLVNDPTTGDKVAHLMPIIEKYTAKTPENDA